jgi:hypothetical protein
MTSVRHHRAGVYVNLEVCFSFSETLSLGGHNETVSYVMPEIRIILKLFARGDAQ